MVEPSSGDRAASSLSNLPRAHIVILSILLALREEMSGDGPCNRLLKAMEEEEKRRQWAPRRIMNESRSRFS